jgi:hypothetical protein
VIISGTMRLAFPCLVLAAAVLALTACSDAPPEERLFEDLPEPTPNKLAGVYQAVITDAGMTTEIRLEFLEGSVEGAVKCTPKNPKYPTLTAGGSATMQTDALEAASGKITVDALTMEKTAEGVFCQAGLRAATYDFKVEELGLTLTTPNTPVALKYGKIGDN